MSSNIIHVKDRLKELRGKLTQAELAQKFGVVAVTISQIENGKQNPSWDLALRICEEFDCSMDWLQGRSDVKNIQQLEVVDDGFKEKFYQKLIENSKLKDKVIQLQDDLLASTA